jgi:hypothetical protein
MIIIDKPQNVRVDFEKTQGTLVITEEGVGFKVPRGKRHSEVVIPWDKMTQAFEILKNVPGFTTPNVIDDGAIDADFPAPDNHHEALVDTAKEAYDNAGN